MAGVSGGSVMVAVRALDRSSNKLLRKAAQLALLYQTDLHLVHLISQPYGPMVTLGSDLRQAVKKSVSGCEQALNKLAGATLPEGVRFKVSSAWDYPAGDAIVRQVLRHRPLMLLAESRHHGKIDRLLLSNTDWELIRNCPCPLWLSKADRSIAQGKVLAAVDPFHARSKPTRLDDIILQFAIAAAGGQPGRVNIAHIYALPQPVVVDDVVMPNWIPVSVEEKEQYAKTTRAAVERLAQRHLIPSRNLLVQEGQPSKQLPLAVEQSGAKVLVMGAVSRSGLRRLFIGNTAEQVIDGVDCDVLVVKPRGFRTVVPRRPSPILPFPAV